MESLFALPSMSKMTFKPTKSHKEGSKRAQLHNYTRRTLGMGYIRQAVQLPAGEDYNEWLATHVIDFFNGISLLVGIVTDESQARLEPGWGFPPGFEYLWVSALTPEHVHTRFHLSAPPVGFNVRLYGSGHSIIGPWSAMLLILPAPARGCGACHASHSYLPAYSSTPTPGRLRHPETTEVLWA
jgi:MOB kinase activator 1